MAFCSAVTLCFASIFSLAAAALLAISFSTDNWQVISVAEEYNAAEPVQNEAKLRAIAAKIGQVFYIIFYKILSYNNIVDI